MTAPDCQVDLGARPHPDWQREPAGPEPADHRAGPFPRRAAHEDPSSVRARPQTAVGHAHRRPCRRQPQFHPPCSMPSASPARKRTAPDPSGMLPCPSAGVQAPRSPWSLVRTGDRWGFAGPAAGAGSALDPATFHGLYSPFRWEMCSSPRRASAVASSDTSARPATSRLTRRGGRAVTNTTSTPVMTHNVPASRPA